MAVYIVNEMSVKFGLKEIYHVGNSKLMTSVRTNCTF